MTAHMCPVCGYGMEDPPQDYNICPCCGTEFGLHDAERTHDQLRSSMISKVKGADGVAPPTCSESRLRSM
jgi:predicted amidophosphoribosyltransferase